jgi:tRNA A37 threonylcarbamoyltransferase TsaD
MGTPCDSSRKYALGIVESNSHIDSDNSEDITSIFDPVMSDILELACKQRNKIMKSKHKKPKAIFLVGGLGGNRFLYERLQAEFATGDIEVIQPRGPNV